MENFINFILAGGEVFLFMGARVARVKCKKD